MARPTSPPPLRIVLDTNVYIAAALNPDGLLFRLVRDSAARHLAHYATSEEILLELQHKLETKLQFERPAVVAWLGELRRVVEVVYPTRRLLVVKRDPDDNKIVECALQAKAQLIITADIDLLALKSFEDIQILHPNSFKYIFPQIKR